MSIIRYDSSGVDLYVRPTPKGRFVHVGYRCPRCRETVDLRTTDPEGRHASLVAKMAREHECARA